MTNLASRFANLKVRRLIQIGAGLALLVVMILALVGEVEFGVALGLIVVSLISATALKLALVAIVETLGTRAPEQQRTERMKAPKPPRGGNLRAAAVPRVTTFQVDERRRSLAERANRLPWFHALELGGFQTSGRFAPGVPPNCTLYPAIDLVKKLDVRGSDCLDIGTAHGLMAFGLEAMGGDVTATDILPEPSPSFSLAHEALESSVSYVHNVPLRDATGEFGLSSFDVVVCAGVMYHLLDPVDVVRIPRQLLRGGGYLVLETAYDPSSQAPTLYLNASAEPLVTEPRTYWLPSENAVTSLLELFGFRVLGIRYIRKPNRLAVLAQSESASSLIGDVSDQVRRTWEVGFQDPLAAHDAWNPEPDGVSQARDSERVEPFRTEIDIYSYQPDFPPHPIAMSNVFGKAR